MKKARNVYWRNDCMSTKKEGSAEGRKAKMMMNVGIG